MAAKYGEAVNQHVLRYGKDCKIVTDPVSGYRFLEVHYKHQWYQIPLSGGGYFSRAFRLGRVGECEYVLEALINAENVGLPNGIVFVINNAPAKANLCDPDFVT